MNTDGLDEITSDLLEYLATLGCFSVVDTIDAPVAYDDDLFLIEHTNLNVIINILHLKVNRRIRLFLSRVTDSPIPYVYHCKDVDDLKEYLLKFSGL